ncbi:MAG: hypothetical protein HOQ07_06755 [Sinomonas sp.]|nr:hypothetical protein [Sinomonas sp.]
MKKRKVIPGLAGVCCAAMLLTGCGGGSGQKAATLPSLSTSTSTTAAATSSAPATSATTSSSAATSSPSSNVPAAVLPADFKIVVDAPTPTDPTQQAIWSGWLSFYQAEYQAVGGSNADDPLYKQWTGEAGNGAPSAQETTRQFILQFQSSGLTVSGTMRLYQRAILGTSAQGTHLSWCEDQTFAYAKDVKTGVVQKTQPSRKDFDYYESYERQGADGRWITIWIHGVKGDNRCK